MSIEQLLAGVTPEVFENLKYVVETGKWQNGRIATQEQKDNALQLVIAYQSKIEKSTQHFTIGEDGEMVVKSKSELKKEFLAANDIARFDENDI